MSWEAMLSVKEADRVGVIEPVAENHRGSSGLVSRRRRQFSNKRNRLAKQLIVGINSGHQLVVSQPIRAISLTAP